MKRIYRWLIRRIKIILCLVFFFFSLVLILKYLNIPYFYIALEIFLVLVFIIVKIKRPEGFKAFLFNLALVVLCLGFVEVYFADDFSLLFPWLDRGRSDPFYVLDEIRGYALAKNIKAESRRKSGDKIIYDVVYTSNQHGLRISPHDLNSPDTINRDFQNIAFFGGSFTFGEGVNDNETLPYLLEEKSKGKYRTYNFGFLSYGPHQMLAILKSDLLDKILTDKKPAIAVYQALLVHIDRASGDYPYIFLNPDGPMYKLDSSRKVKRIGKFSDRFRNKGMHYFIDGHYSRMGLYTSFPHHIFFQLHKSYLFQRILFKALYELKRSRKQIELFVKIIKKSKDIFAQKYDGRFYVILWTDKIDKDYDYVLSELKRKQIEVITTDEISEKYSYAIENCMIDKDNHPNKLAYEMIANYLLEYIR